MKIALLADEDPGWGGIGTYVGVLGEALRDLGHDVHLVLRGWEDDGSESVGGLTVHRVTVPEPSWRRGTVAAVSRVYLARQSLVFSLRAARVIARIGPGIVEAPEFHAPGLIAALRSRLSRGAPPVVVRLHAPSFLVTRLAAEPGEPDLYAVELLEAGGVRCARSITAPSRALADIVRRRWRVPAGRVHVIANPIDDHVFSPASTDEEVPGSILVVGRLERAKGQDVLVEALPSIREVVPEAHVRLIGADGGTAATLARRARVLGVADAVTFEGALPRAALPGAYRAAALCVVPSRFEAFPYSALEAMACGRPIVAARAGALPEMLDDGANGRLIPSEDPGPLADAVGSLLQDPTQRVRLGRAARTKAVSSFAAGAVAARMAEHYTRIAS